MTAAAVLAAALAATAGALLPGGAAGGAATRLRRLAGPRITSVRAPARAGAARGRGTDRARLGAARPVPVGLAALVAVAVVSRDLGVAAVLAACTSGAGAVAWARRRRRQAAARMRGAVCELCQALVGELRSGAAPGPALAAAARGLAGLDDLTAVAGAPHGDVAAALLDLADEPGGEGLRRLQACWRVSERFGSGLEASVSRLASSLRGEEQVRREVAAQLAGPRATAVLLMLLPLLGALMGGAMGVGVVRVLLATPLGVACLLAGLTLELLGLLWTARLARAAEPP